MTDESAPYGCRRIKPWAPSVISKREYPNDAFDDPSEQEESELEQAMQECGKVPAAEGGCLMAGTEYCDFDCPFRDEDDEDD